MDADPGGPVGAGGRGGALQRGRPALGCSRPTWGKTATAYDGEYTTVTDPAGKKRRSRLDGLGRLVRVDEPTGSPGSLGSTGSPNQATSYGYNALDNLTRVTQGTQTRTFAYDSLSRLTSAANPESGTIAYTYDNNGNLTQRTDARGVVTAYTYDRLDRLTRRSYSYTGSDTAVSLGTTRVDYAYDSCGSYSEGRPCSVTAKKGAADISRTAYNRYDALARVLESTQTTGGQAYTMAYSYDRAGNLTSQRYPSDRVVDYLYDGAGRIAGAKTGIDDWYAGGTGGNAAEYEPHGGVKQLLLGNGLWEQRRYNARLQPTRIGLGTTKTAGSLTATGSGLLLLDYSYGTTANNGNVLSQRIRVGTSFNQNQAYTYDALNRLKTAAETGSGTGWSQTYAYDRYGNRRVTAGASHGSNQALTPQSTADIATATNRLAGTKGVNLTVAYDAAGNLKANWAGNAFKYDGDNRLVAFDNAIGTDSDTTYAYDGDGKRVRKVVGGSSGITTTYVYNILGQLVAEYASQGTALPGIRYLTPDHLGSTRVVTAQDQSVLSRHDYLPFGEEIGSGLGNRSAVSGYTASHTGGPAQKFTGKERDAESGLDYFGARYFGGAGGRFTSADAPLVDQSELDPQSWNLYTYTRNNPLKYIDPTGQLIELTGETEEERQAALEAIRLALVNSKVADQLHITQNEEGQFIVAIMGDTSQFRKAGDLEADLEGVISSNTVVEFGFSDTLYEQGTVFGMKVPSFLNFFFGSSENVSRRYGGAVTADKDHTPSGNITVVVDPGALNDRQAEGAECVNKFETAEFPKLSYFLYLCRRIDPHLVRRSGDPPGSVDETLRVLVVSAIQSLLTSLENRAGLTVMDHRRREPAQARMVVDMVVPVEKAPTEGLGVLDGTESFGEVGAVLQGFELGFRERVVVGHLRPGVGLGHTQVRQQQCHHLRLHRRAAVSVENQLTAIDPLLVTAFTNQLFSQSRRFAIGHHPPHHLAAEDVEDHVEGEGGPLPGPLQPGDIPGPDIGWGLSLTVPASGRRDGAVGGVVRALPDSHPESGTWCVPSTNSGLYPAGPHRPGRAPGPGSARYAAGRGRLAARRHSMPEVTVGGPARHRVRPPAADAGTATPGQPRRPGTPPPSPIRWRPSRPLSSVVVSLVRALERYPQQRGDFFLDLDDRFRLLQLPAEPPPLPFQLSDALVSGVLRPGFPSSLRRTPARQDPGIVLPSPGAQVRAIQTLPAQ